MKAITWQTVLSYLGVGFVFAIIRVYFHGRHIAEYGHSDNESIQNHIFRWWFIWPISLIYWIFSSLAEEVWGWVYDRFESTFKYFYNLGLKSKKK